MQKTTLKKPLVLIVSPALAKANNGNWHTAARWARMLHHSSYRFAVESEWSADAPAPDALLALHARRSASSIAAFAEHHPTRPLVLALTGTDVYRDIHTADDAKESLRLATSIITLQDQAATELPVEYQSKVTVIYQSASKLAAKKSKPLPLKAVMVGHFRAEKSPKTFMHAAVRLKHVNIKFIHIGSALEGDFGDAALDTARKNLRYKWLGNLARAETRKHLQAAHVMVICSVMEGGANVICEALMSGTPVLASRISGNIGMLGKDYAGYFDVDQDAQLAVLLQRCNDDAAFLALLNAQCAERAVLFEPSRERASLVHLMDSLFEKSLDHERT